MAPDPEKVRAAKQRYRERNREKIRAQARAYSREYARKNAEQLREKTLRYREANPDKVKKWRDNDVARNREARLQRQRRWHHANGWAKQLWNHHGMRPENWDALLEGQGGCCYLCGDPLTERGSGKIAIDHDHSCCPDGRSCSYCRRGITCGTCNPLVGFAQDDPDRLRRVADNLERVLNATRARIATKPRQLSLINGSGEGDEDEPQALGTSQHSA